MTDAQPQTPLEQQRSKSATVGFYLGLLGLGLIFLGGCFLIGVMIVQFSAGPYGAPPGNSPAVWSVFLWLLYLLAFACFGGGVFVMINAVKRLMAS